MKHFRLIPLLAASLCVFPAVGAETYFSLTATVPASWNFTSEIISAKTFPLQYSATQGLSVRFETTIQHNGPQPGTPNHYLIALRKPVALALRDNTSVSMKVAVDGVTLGSTPNKLLADPASSASGNASAPGARRTVVDVTQDPPGPLPEGHYQAEVDIVLTPAI